MVQMTTALKRLLLFFGNWKLRKNKVYKILWQPMLQEEIPFLPNLSIFWDSKDDLTHTQCNFLPLKELSKRTHTTQKKNLFTYSKSKMGLLQVTSISASKYNLSSFPSMNDEGFICRHRSSLKLMPSKPKDDELEILANSISLKSSLSLQYPIPFFPSSLALTNHYVRKKAKMEDWQRIISLNQITIQGTMH